MSAQWHTSSANHVVNPATHLTFKTLARAKISILFLEETLWAMVAAYLLVCINKSSNCGKRACIRNQLAVSWALSPH